MVNVKALVLEDSAEVQAIATRQSTEIPCSPSLGTAFTQPVIDLKKRKGLEHEEEIRPISDLSPFFFSRLNVNVEPEV